RGSEQQPHRKAWRILPIIQRAVAVKVCSQPIQLEQTNRHSLVEVNVQPAAEGHGKGCFRYSLCPKLRISQMHATEQCLAKRSQPAIGAHGHFGTEEKSLIGRAAARPVQTAVVQPNLSYRAEPRLWIESNRTNGSIAVEVLAQNGCVEIRI